MLTRNILASSLSAILACLLWTGPAGAADKLRVGDQAPDVFGKPAAGEKIHLSDYRGKIVVISFWASWCGPCRKEMATMLKVQKFATRDKLLVLSVNWREDRDTFREIRRTLKDQDLTLISDQRGDMGEAYDVHAIPHTIIVGRDGRIAAIYVGYGDDEIPEIVDTINALWLKD